MSAFSQMPTPARAISALATLILLTGCSRAVTFAPGWPASVAVPSPTNQLQTAEGATPTPGPSTWTGLPSYTFDGYSPLLFQLEFDAEEWDLVIVSFGRKLVHRSIPGCEITPIIGGELSEEYSVEHGTKLIGGISYEINLVYRSNQLEYITYFTQLGKPLTGFLVWNQDGCIEQGEAVLATLQSIGNPAYSP